MADDEGLAGRRAVHVTTVQAWRTTFAGDGGAAGDGLDAIVVDLGVDEGDVPPLIVPVDAVAGLVGVLLQAAGVDLVGEPTALTIAAADADADAGDPAGPPPSLPEGSGWPALLAAERTRASELARATLPSGPGAYVWFRAGVPIHLGRAVGQRGLRARIGGDALRGDADLSRSPFRAAVAAHLGFGLDAGGFLAHLSADQVERLDRWIAGCDVSWLRCATRTEASRLEATLRAAHDPEMPVP